MDTICSLSIRSHSRATQHPRVEPDDDPNESDHAEIWSECEVFSHKSDWRVVRRADDEARVENTPKTLTDDQSRRDERPESFSTIRIRSSASAPAVPLRQHCADYYCERRRHRQVNTDTDCERWDAKFVRGSERSVEQNQTNTDCCADADHLPFETAADHAFREGRDQSRLWRGQWICGNDAYICGACKPVSFREQVKHKRNYRRTGDNADDQRDLLAHRRCANKLARLQVLQVVVRDRRARKNDRRDEERKGDEGWLRY